MATERSGTEAGAGGFAVEGSTITEPEILAKPNVYYQTLRMNDPVHYDPKLGMYLVSRYEDLEKVLRDPITFSLELGYHKQWAGDFLEELKEILNRDGGGYFPDAIMCDPPRHARLRRLMDKAFTAHRIKSLEPEISTIVADLIENLADKGRAEAIEEFAIPLTTGFMRAQLGLGDLATEKIHRWSVAYTSLFGLLQSREELLECARQICELQNYVIDRVRERQADPREDMISDLVRARLDDEENPTLTFPEVVSLTRALIVGGNDTISTALTNLLLALATRPEIAKKLRDVAEDDRLLSRFVEELLRLEPPVRGLSRVTTKEVELGGKQLPAGAHLLVLFASGNDDEGEFSCPRQFDMDRSNLGRHLSFGTGIHRCVGQSLARMEIKVAAREIARRVDKIELAIPEEEIRYIPSVSMLSIERLPLIFSRRR